MTQYVLILSVGPVQGFIASARRSRDLWAGSWLLSELAKAVAKNLHDKNKDEKYKKINEEKQIVNLIFPFVKNPDDLEPNSEFSVGNKIQAVVTANSVEQLKDIANSAKNAANIRFSDIANKVKKYLDEQGLSLRENHLWDCQAGDYVEVQYAWAKIGSTYHKASEVAAQLLAARKVTRDFLPSKAKDNPDSPIRAVVSAYDSACRMPKSSLDGARETVLPDEPNGALRKKLGLSQSEQLDCVGVVKRLYGETFHSKNNKDKKLVEQFTPITRVAANDWICKIVNMINGECHSKGEKLNDSEREELKNSWNQVKEQYKCLVNHNLATCVSGNDGIYSDFPYDAELLYRSRLEAKIVQFKAQNKKNAEKILELECKSEKDVTQLEEIKAQQKENSEYIKELESLRTILQNIWRRHGEPCPYYAMLSADGDKMGELIDKAETQKNHQRITENLSEFARNVPNIMRKHKAQYIYAGGDDVLGLVTLSNAIECAEELAKEFSGSLKPIAEQLNAEEVPTLSVGLAICHIMAPLGIVRALAKRAEKVAKGDHVPKNQQRNALGITLALRSGTTIDMRLRWNDNNKEFEQFKQWIAAYANDNNNDTLSSRVAYDCRDIFMRTDFRQPDAKEVSQKELDDFFELQNKIREAELKRMLSKARDANGKELSQSIQEKLLNRYEKLNNLNDLATELIIARWLAAKTQRDLGRDN